MKLITAIAALALLAGSMDVEAQKKSDDQTMSTEGPIMERWTQVLTSDKAWTIQMESEPKWAAIEQSVGGFPAKRRYGPFDIKKSLAVAAEKVGLPKLTRHMMRHTFATFLGSKGATDMDLMDLGGWKSVAMVRRYRKIVDERLDDVMDAFNEDGEEQISER